MRTACTAALLLAASLAAAAVGPAVPPLTGPVVDRAGLLDPAAQQRIAGLIRAVQQKTGAQMAVLVMPTVAPLDPFDFGMRTVEAWQLGSRERDDGLLMLVVLEPRAVRIFPGYGLEGVLPDGRVGEILDHAVVPAFRAGRYADGIYDGLAAAAAAIEGEAPPPVPTSRRRAIPAWMVLAGFALLVVLLLAFSGPGGPGPSVRSRGRRRIYPYPPFGGPFGGPRLPGGFGGGFGGGGGGFGGGGAGRS